MSYVPINISAFVAAYSGAISGMAVSGWIVDPASSDYALVSQIAGAFAQEFDTIWNSATALNNLENTAISQIVAQEFSARGPGPLNSGKFSNPSNWAIAAVACAALVLQSDAYFAGQGINPGTGGTGFAVAGIPAIGKVVGWDGTQPIWEAVPSAFLVTGFSINANLVLIGANVVSPGFTASYNRPATAVQLTDNLAHSDAIALPGTAFVSPHTFQKTVYGQSVTFTDTANDASGSAGATSTLFWGQDVYFGSVADPGGGGYNAAFIQALGAVLKLDPAGTYGYNAGAGQSAFFCCRTAFGKTPANFTVGGFPFACSMVATGVAVTNNGIAENFDVFRSDNVALGAFNLVEA